MENLSGFGRKRGNAYGKLIPCPLSKGIWRIPPVQSSERMMPYGLLPADTR
jgi:hypothetical protein